MELKSCDRNLPKKKKMHVTETQTIFRVSGRQLAQCDIDFSAPIPHCETHLLALLPIQVKRLQTHTMQSSVCLPRRKTSLLSPLREEEKKKKKELWTNSQSLPRPRSKSRIPFFSRNMAANMCPAYTKPPCDWNNSASRSFYSAP